MPTIIKLFPDYPGQLKLREYLHSNLIKPEDQKERFHSTIYYAGQTPLFKRKEIFI